MGAAPWGEGLSRACYDTQLLRGQGGIERGGQPSYQRAPRPPRPVGIMALNSPASLSTQGEGAFFHLAGRVCAPLGET